ADLQPAAARAGVNLVHRPPGEPVLVDGDHEQLHRAVANLLSNAVKFTPPGGRVGASAVVGEDGDVALTVSDTGIGIPAADQRQLFTRFFRASNATEQVIQGTGLGLTIVKAIISHHGGQVDVTSVENEGTSVTIRLPRSSADVAGRGVEEGLDPVPGDDQPRIVVVVDDLADLAGPVHGVVDLPTQLLCLPDRAFDLDDPGYLRWFYEAVLREATTVHQLRAWLHGGTLVRLWPELYLPASVRRAWLERHPC